MRDVDAGTVDRCLDGGMGFSIARMLRDGWSYEVGGDRLEEGNRVKFAKTKSTGAADGERYVQGSSLPRFGFVQVRVCPGSALSSFGFVQGSSGVYGMKGVTLCCTKGGGTSQTKGKSL